MASVTPLVIALAALMLVVIWALLDSVLTMNRAEDARPWTASNPRQVFIERLRATGTPAQLDYATVLELSPPRPGESVNELAEGYRAYLAQLPEPVTAPLRYRPLNDHRG